MHVTSFKWTLALAVACLLAPITATVGAESGPQPASAQSADPKPGAQTAEVRAAEEQAAKAQACVRHALAEDARLGKARNHAPETQPIDEAVERYVAGMGGIDLRGCPAAFVTAFTRHRRAWQDAQPLLARHATERGEMHEVFDRLRAGPDGPMLESAEAAIWSTWAEVERATSAAGVASP